MLPEEITTSVAIPNMSWFQTTNFASLAKSALKEAQKTIDKALDIRDESSTPASPREDTENLDDVALTESEIQIKTKSPPPPSIPEDNGVESEVINGGAELNPDPLGSVISLSDSNVIEEGDAESKWSTIEMETEETGHSRNSSISTIPDTNSTSSPERDVTLSRNVGVTGQAVSIVNSVCSSTVQNPSEFSTPVKTAEEHDSCVKSVEGTVPVVAQLEAENSQSSSSFEHVISNSVEPNQGEPVEDRGGSVNENSPCPPVVAPSSCNKLVTKIKTNASSASSSDIEVIPLDPEEQQTISKILQEAETQTDENLFVIPKQEKIKVAKGDDKIVVQLEDRLKEKDKEIKQLLEEGEKLSKKQFDLSNVVKKLRAKEREQDNNIKAVKAELAEKAVELERVTKIFVNKERIEQEQNERISRLNGENRKLELEIERLKSELEDAVENCNTMKISMENTSIELLEKENIILATQQNAGELDRLTREKSELLNRSETLQKEVDHLRTVVNETQNESSQRELQLKSQLTALTAKCHKLENELSDVSSEIADATMPLSLEIEKLQQELKSNQAAGNKREASLSAKLSDLEHKLKVASDRESSLREMGQSVETTIRSLESKIDEVEEENKRLKISIKEIQANSEKALRNQEVSLQDALSEIERLKQANQSLQNELRSEQTEKKKIQQLFDQQMRSSQSNTSTSTLVTTSNGGQGFFDASTSMTSSANTTLTSGSQKSQGGHRSGENSPSSQSVLSEVSYLDEVFDANGQNLRSMTPKSFFESFSSANVIENLHAQLRLREGELINFQEECSKNEKIRKSLNEEIAQLTIQNQELLLQTEKLTELQIRFDELEKNYNAVLQMYGEKVEEADELRLDLQDVKKMYKDQINELMMRDHS